MPNYKGHLFGATVFYCAGVSIIKQFLKPTFFTALEWLLFSLIGGLFPDIDIKSKGQKYFYQVIGVLLLALLLTHQLHAFAITSFMALLPLMVRHRGLTHSLGFIASFCLLIMAIVHGVWPRYAPIIFFDTLFFFLGAFSHLVLDLGIKRTLRF